MTDTSPMFCHQLACSSGHFYYSATEIIANITGLYSFVSSSSLDTYGLLYNATFYPNDVNRNQLLIDDDTAGESQFRITFLASMSESYILVVTTYNPETIGSVLIVTNGPGPVTFRMVDSVTTVSSKYNDCKIQDVHVLFLNHLDSTISTWTVTTLELSLNSSSSVFCRYNAICITPNYYYSAFLLNVSFADTYTIETRGSLDSFGSLYEVEFNPSNSSENLLLYNDDGSGSSNFYMTAFLEPSSDYIIVVTTYENNITGTYTLDISGNGRISIKPL